MSTIVHYECRNLEHLRAASRRGNGGLVTHHGSVGYCDGVHVDGAHRWVATGGVPIEFLFERGPDVVRPSANGRRRLEGDEADMILVHAD
jgi:hypothetical protein